MMYYRYVDALVRTLSADAKSMLDVGPGGTPIIEAFDWVDRRDTVDLVEPYKSQKVHGIEADFLAFEPRERYAFALCLQVLEHIPDVVRFARHLFDVADNVLVSVPFLWPEDSNAGHIHDPVDREKLAGWTGRDPDYQVVVTELLMRTPKSRRLIAYYHTPEVPFSLYTARERLKTLCLSGHSI